MNLSGFPRCCGAVIVFGFSQEDYINGRSKKSDITVEMMQKFLKTISSSVAIAITVPQQEIDPVLEETGWIRLARFRNSITKTINTVWMRSSSESVELTKVNE